MKTSKILPYLFIAALSLFTSFSAHGTQVFGADISWKCLGNDSFEIIVHAYRDCNGNQLDGHDLTYQSASGGCVNSPQPLNPDVCCGTDATPVCPNMCDRAISNPNCYFPYGIEEFTITAGVRLPSACCDYIIAWQERNRSSGITTGAKNANFYIEANINRCITPYVSSPYFTEQPISVICINQCIVYNPGIADISKDSMGRADSLAYSFVNPLRGHGDTIGYTSPYTYNAPLSYAGSSPTQAFDDPNCYGFHLDSITGEIRFKATKAENTPMVLLVDIYRKDSLGIARKVGEIMRDMEIIAIKCPSDMAPIVQGINGDSTYTIKVCAGGQTCFNVNSVDSVSTDSVTETWNNPGTMNGATFTVKSNGQLWPTGVFCWTPTDKDVRSYPYSFVVSAKDDACPIPATASAAFTIYVFASPYAEYSATVGKCGLVSFQASQSKTSAVSVSDYLWTGKGAPGYGPLYINGKTGSYQYTRAGKYYYTLTVTSPNGCARDYQDSVIIDPFPAIGLPHDTTICLNASLTVKSTLINTLPPYQIWWNVKDANGDSITSSSITETISKDTAFRVNVSDRGCTNYDSMKVHAEPPLQPNLGPDQRSCEGHSVFLRTGLHSDPITDWTRISGTDTTKINAHTDSIFVSDSGMYTVYVQDSFTCSGTDTANVYFNPLVKAKNLDTTVCFGDSVSLSAGIAGPGATYTWIDELHGKIVDTNKTFKFWASGFSGYGQIAPFEIVISQTIDGITCADTGLQEAYVNAPSYPKLSTLPAKCTSDWPFQLIAGPPYVDSSHSGGTWFYPRNPLAIQKNYLYPAIMGETDTNAALGYVHYIYKNQYGCSTEDSIRIIISSPSVKAGGNHSICIGSSIGIGGPAFTGYSYAWTSKPAGFTSTLANPTVSPVVQTTYYLKKTVNATGCSGTDSSVITVYPLPAANFTFTGVCQGDSSVFTNSSHSASYYKWYFGDGATSTSANPEHLYTAKGNYLVSLKAGSLGGCADSVAKTISVASCVWPGDANDDKIVDMKDLLAIGIAYGSSGHARSSASISWSAQPCQDWADTFSNGVNYKHADCNGDSIVNDKDTVAISANYGNNHPKSNLLNQGSPTDPPFILRSLTDTVYAGDTLKATITIGSNSNLVQNLYGLVFSLNANPALFDVNNAAIKINSSFLGTNGTNIIGMKINNLSTSLTDVGLTRIDHNNASGYGNCAMISIPVSTTLPNNYQKTALGISDNIQISFNEKNVPLYFSSDSFVVMQNRSGIHTVNSQLCELNIYPNPFHSSTVLQYSLTQKTNVRIELSDITGKSIAVITNQNQMPDTFQININAEEYHLAPGIYLLKLSTADGYYSRHIVKL